MSAFALSPGLTPGLTDAFLLELVVGLGVGKLLGGERGVETVLALNGIALAVVKLLTDWADLPDVPVGVAGILGGAAVLVRGRWGVPWSPGGPWPSRVAGAVVLLVGAVKGLGDFYDPFDLMLGAALVVLGLWLAAGRRPLKAPAGHAALR